MALCLQKKKKKRGNITLKKLVLYCILKVYFCFFQTNPPYYVPMVEVVPAPWTSKDVVARTQALMKEIGQSPVTFSKEQPGFGSNRIQ